MSKKKKKEEEDGTVLIRKDGESKLITEKRKDV